MKFIKYLLFSILSIVVILAIAGFFLPSKGHVQRSIVIQSSPDKVFEFINSMQAFNQWSPWAEKDPNTVYEFSGPPAGVGNAMSWKSENPYVGTGTQKIVESVENSMIKTHLDFGSQGTAFAYIQLEETSGSTQVTWGFDTDFGYNIIFRYFGLMYERWIGPDYEKGLAKLKKLAETNAPPQATTQDGL